MYTNLLMEWSLELNKAPLSEISHGDERLYWWVCKHGHRFQMSPIEYHGIQHYKSIEFYGGQQKLMQTQKLDAYKTQYLYSRNIPQLIISYTEFTLIENILNAKLSGVADKISK